MLAPLYALLERVPATRESSLRLGLVRREEMVRALVHAVEHPSRGITILDMVAIRSLASRESGHFVDGAPTREQ